MLVSAEHKQIIEERFERVKEAAKYREEELFSILNECTEDEAICLKYLYAFMPEQDLANHDGKLFLKFVRQALSVRKIVPWGEKLTGGLFLNYVLQCRMSNENIEYYKDELFEEIYPRIEGKSMYEAALIINYWCFEKATYQTTNARTTCPLATIRNAYGRCGEESVLGVAAFRSVGIPARQAYTPRWAHCDDNHAWVEVWVDGEWHFLGACEPEATLDSGWFQLSASRGMLIQSKVFATTVENEIITRQTDSATEVNTLDRYADTKEITIQVTNKEGEPVEGATVGFEVVNYAQLFPLVELQTDATGQAKFVTGYGDLLISVRKGAQATFECMDVRLTNHLTIQLEDHPRTSGTVDTITLVPPTGKSPDENAVTEEMKTRHEAAHTHALNTRKAFVETFYLGDKARTWSERFGEHAEGVARHLESARGNYLEIQAFFEDEATQNLTGYKIKMLDTMEPKDLSDTSAKILSEHLLGALAYKDNYDETVFVQGILAPRAYTEKITAYRKALIEMFSDDEIAAFRINPKHVFDYIQETITTATSIQNMYLCAQPVGLMKLKLGHTMSQKILFVALCRTFGIPAKINKEDHGISYFHNGVWVEIDLGAVEEVIIKDATLTLDKVDDTAYEYMKTYTVGKWHNGTYHTLYLETGEWIDGKRTYALEAGEYRIITVNREASGAVHANLYYVDLAKGQNQVVQIQLATITHKTKEVVIKEASFVNTNGDVVELSEITGENNNIVAYLDAGAEPTEHLLNEMIAAKEQYLAIKPNVILIVKEEKDLDNPTLKKTLQELPFIQVYIGYEKEDLAYIYEAFEILDKKFPLAFVMPQVMKANVAIAGYNVGIGTMLLKYL